MKQKLNIFLSSSWVLPLTIALFILIGFKPFISNFPNWLIKVYIQNSPQTNLTKDTLLSSNCTTPVGPNITGPIGDTYGGTLGPIIGIIAAFMTFLAFWIQYLANRRQDSYLKQQRFEDTFFRLLDHYKKNVDSIDLRDTKDTTKTKASGYECFKLMYDDFAIQAKKNTGFENIIKEFDYLQNRFKHDLHHYFRFLYHVLKYIKQANISEQEKFKYSSILRASLSSHELVLLFYNCLHKNGNTHFKPLLEEFSFLKNLDDSLIINYSQKKQYHDIAFASSREREKLLLDWKVKQQ